MNDPRIYFERGLEYFQKNNFEKAEIEFLHALELSPNRPSILVNLSATLIKLERWVEAENICAKLIKITPDDVEGLINLGTCQINNNKLSLALSSFDSAIEIDPKSSIALCNKGNLLYEINNLSDAKNCFVEALKINPASEESLIGLALTENAFCNYDEGLRHLYAVLKINPNNQKAKWNLALSELRLGNYCDGWGLYESRWQIPGLKESLKPLSSPLWLGQHSISGKTIFIYSEQGYGDIIQMSRYLPLLVKMGAKVIFETPQNLCELMKSLDPEITVYAKGEIQDYSRLKHDYHCPIMSLPLAFKTTLDSVPSKVPYLHSNSSKAAFWNSILASNNQLSNLRKSDKASISIGITWSGSGHYAGKINSRRNLPFIEVVNLCNSLLSEQISFHCLHPYPLREELLSVHRPKNLYFHVNQLESFADTAALISNLDLIVSIDTATAHLSGALAKPTILLIPNPPDFMSLTNRKDSPWYPKTRLLRQEESGHWNLSKLVEQIQRFRA